jgi:hypothetical protein
VDGYKGDLARNYFYMATRYKGEDSGWPGSPMTDGADLEQWAVDMLIQWHLDDPVSAKEVERNDAVYAIQENRNPFIDHPEFVQMIYDPQAGVETSPGQQALFCFPNPASDEVNLEVSLPSSGPPAGRVLDVTGRTVAALEFAHAGSSQYHACWSCSDASPGVYFAVAESEGNRICSPVLVLR